METVSTVYLLYSTVRTARMAPPPAAASNCFYSATVCDSSLTLPLFSDRVMIILFVFPSIGGGVVQIRSLYERSRAQHSHSNS